MHASCPITTIKLWSKKTLVQNNNDSVSDIDLRHLTANGFFSLSYAFCGAGRLKFEYFTAADKGGDYVEGAADIVSSITPVRASDPVDKRACATGVATLTGDHAHSMSAGGWVIVDGMTDNGYNGLFQVIAVPSSTTFTFALPNHADEDEVSAGAGRYYPLAVGTIAFTPKNPVPFLKIKMTEINVGAINLANVWLHVQ